MTWKRVEHYDARPQIYNVSYQTRWTETSKWGGMESDAAEVTRVPRRTYLANPLRSAE